MLKFIWRCKISTGPVENHTRCLWNYKIHRCILYFSAKYAKKCVVFLKTLHSWQEFYMTAGRGGRNKFQVWGKVYPTRASFSRSLPSMQTKVPRGLEGRSPRNPPRISISFSQSLPSMQTKIPTGLWGPKPKEPSWDLNICHQWRGQGTLAHNLPIWQHISIFTTFEKQSMINQSH